MSRIIKFRVWDKKFGMMYGDGISVQGDGTFYLERADHDGNEIEIAESEHGELVLMQFTGLLDKNGKEIWEGDVVAISGMYDPETGQTGTDLCEVKYEGPSLMYVRVDGGDKNSVESLIGVRSQDEDAEVIGNIHENPELLKP